MIQYVTVSSQVLNTLICLKVFASRAEDTVLAGVVALTGFLAGHFAHSGSLELYFPNSPKNNLVVDQYVSCGIFNLQGPGSSVD